MADVDILSTYMSSHRDGRNVDVLSRRQHRQVTSYKQRLQQTEIKITDRLTN